MPTWIALFRGINVGGKNKLPMAELRGCLTEAGLQDVRTYIQSGNAIFQTKPGSPESIACTIADAVDQQFGFRPPVLVIKKSRLTKAIETNPFLGSLDIDHVDGSQHHIFFLERKPKAPDLEPLQTKASKSERFELVGDLFFLHAADGIARSKLAASVEASLGVTTTARNLNTVRKLLKMLES